VKGAHRIRRLVHTWINQISKDRILPMEAADSIFDVIAIHEQYDVVDEVMRLLPVAVHERLKDIVAEVDRTGTKRTYTFGRRSAEAQEEQDRGMPACFKKVADLLKHYWSNWDKASTQR
jgi:hypothetical protein